MADDSDEEQPKRIIENQPYDETLEVPDGEDVASIYTPTPRNPKSNQIHHQQQQQQNFSRAQLYPQQANQTRQTPPPSSSSVSSGSLNTRPRTAINSIKTSDIKSSPIKEENDNQLVYQPAKNPIKQPKMSESSQAETPKGNEPSNPNKMQQDMGDSGSEGNESDESQENFNDLPGAYDPAAFRDLPVSNEIKEIFRFIERYQPQNIELDFKLKPFIPDYIPSIGDIDAFIKIPRPDAKQDNLGLTVVDEPSSNQSDPHVLDLFFRTLSKQTTEVINQPTTVKSVEGANTKAIESWIRNISALQKNKPIQTVNYQRAMPSIDNLMQVWPAEFEELLKEVSLPSPELNVDLNTYVDILCSLLDVPVYKSRIQSIHVLFTLFSEFKNSEHFKNPAHISNPYASSNFKGNQTYEGKSNKGSDRLVIE